MSETNKELEPLSDPGLPEHVHRKTDVDPLAAKKAERQVSILFTLSALGTILFVYAYVWIPEDTLIFLPLFNVTNAHQLFLGLGLAMALFFIGMGAVHWAKTLMPEIMRWSIIAKNSALEMKTGQHLLQR
ncbi:MAG: hypothetical protein EBX77_03505 [Actinobacteria bacterium]|nr:hypothetical protein [Actinomycetota bacterium]